MHEKRNNNKTTINIIRIIKAIIFLHTGHVEDDYVVCLPLLIHKRITVNIRLSV